MQRIKLGRPSPALVISCIALFVALGGVGYAAATGSIDGREIKNNSVASKDIKNSSIVGGDVKTSGLTGSDVKENSLTGSDIAETGLGKVPSAATADSAGTASSAGTAGSAGSAGTVGGLTLRKVNFRADSAADGPIASLAGLTLFASCAASNVTLTARTAVNDSDISTTVADTDGDNDEVANDLEQGFDSTTTFNLLDTGTGNPAFVRFVYAGNDGRTVSGLLWVDEAGGSPLCKVVGTLTGG